MMKFESDLNTDANTTIIPTGTPDLLDEWYESDAEVEARIDQDWGDWIEETYDPDGPHFQHLIGGDSDLWGEM